MTAYPRLTDKDTRRIAFDAIRAGCRWTRGRRHLKLWPPDGVRRPIVVPISPSDHRTAANLRAELRRRGIDV